MGKSLITVFAIILCVLCATGLIVITGENIIRPAYQSISNPTYDFTSGIQQASNVIFSIGKMGNEVINTLGLGETYNLRLYVTRLLYQEGEDEHYAYIIFWRDINHENVTGTNYYGKIYAFYDTTENSRIDLAINQWGFQYWAQEWQENDNNLKTWIPIPEVASGRAFWEKLGLYIKYPGTNNIMNWGSYELNGNGGTYTYIDTKEFVPSDFTNINLTYTKSIFEIFTESENNS